MLDPEQAFEYEQKCDRIVLEIEMLILDGIIAALERLNFTPNDAGMKTLKTPADMDPF